MSQSSFGQFLGTVGNFSVDKVTGCTPLTVQVANILVSDNYLYSYDNGVSWVPTANFTFTQSGTFWLKHLAFANQGTQNLDSVQIEVLDPISPSFEAISCNGNAVAVNITDMYYDSFDVDYGDGSAIIPVIGGTNPPVYTYPVPGTFAVVVTGLFNFSPTVCATSSINFTPVDTLVPAQISSIEVQGDSIIVGHSLSPNIDYDLEISINGFGNFQSYSKISAPSGSTTIPNLFTASNYYCFRITAFDACSNFSVQSNQACSIGASALAINNAVDLSWNVQNNDPTANLTMFRNSTLLTNLNLGEFNYQDTTAVCGADYCYQIQLTDGLATSTSDILCVTAFSTDIPMAVENISLQVSDEEVLAIWPQTSGGRYVVLHSENQGPLLRKDTVMSSSSLISAIGQDGPQCVSLIYEDICGNKSLASSPACSVFLSGTSDDKSNVNLGWTDFMGWANGVDSYVILKLDELGNVIDSIDVGFTFSFDDPAANSVNQVMTYQIKAVPVDLGLPISLSNKITITRKPYIFFPNAFTPNQDNLNDLFYVQGRFIAEMELIIVNRWGELVFHTLDWEDAWDGSNRHELAPQGVYSYKAIIKDLVGDSYTRSGVVLLLKKN